jgi:pimeloyl-ACP methyl ester carboxylesterase
MNFLANNLNRLVWPRFISSRDNPKPEDPAWMEFRRDSCDGVSIFGRCLRAGDDARGTIVFVHGFTTNGGVFRDLAYQLRDRLGMHVITPDLRHHGLSGDRPPTFGTAESWDLAACLDWAEETGLPRPFSVMGESLGGMAVQRLIVEDARVDHAVCIHPPGWPWDAIGKNVAWSMDGILANLPPPARALISPLKDKAVGVGQAINEAYGFDILNDGDPRCHTPNPPGNPRILYIFGEDDPYEPDKARQVWRHFYPEETAREGAWPGDGPKQKKYFITVPGFRHFPPGPTVFEWDGFWPLIESFFASNTNKNQTESKSHV